MCVGELVLHAELRCPGLCPVFARSAWDFNGTQGEEGEEERETWDATDGLSSSPSVQKVRHRRRLSPDDDGQCLRVAGANADDGGVRVRRLLTPFFCRRTGLLACSQA